MLMDEFNREAEKYTGISNVTFDLMSVLTNTLEAIPALEHYKADARQAGDTEVLSLFEEIERHGRESVDKLSKLLAKRLPH